MAQLRRWTWNVSTGFLSIGAEGLALLLMTPILVSNLGVAQYAGWMLAQTVMFYLRFLNLGLAGAQIRFHARFASRELHDEVQKLMRTSIGVLMLLGVVATVIGLALAAAPPRAWLQDSILSANELRGMLALLSLNLLVAFPGSAFVNLYDGMQRMDLRNLRTIGGVVLRSVGQLTLLHLGHGVIALALLEVAVNVVLLVADLLITARLMPGVLGVGIDARIWRRIRPFALWNFFSDLLIEGSTRLGTLLVSFLLQLAVVTPYTLSLTLAGMLPALTHPISTTFLPMCAALHARGQRRQLSELFAFASKGLFAVCLPVAIVLIVFGDDLLALWVPDIRGRIPLGLVTLLILDALFSVLFSMAALVLIAMNRMRQFVVLMLVEALCGLGVGVLLVPLWGASGLALGSLLSNVAFGLGLQMPLVCRSLKSSYPRLLGGAARLAIAALPALAVGAAMRERLPVERWTDLPLPLLLTGATAVFGVAVVGVSGDDRRRMLALWPQLRRKETT